MEEEAANASVMKKVFVDAVQREITSNFSCKTHVKDKWTFKLRLGFIWIKSHPREAASMASDVGSL